MKLVVRAFALLLFFVGNNSATPPPGPLHDPTESRASSVQGEKPAPVKTVTCDWASDRGADSIELAEDNAVKLALYEAIVSGKGIVRAKKDCATFEGDPAPVYATAKGGKIKISRDYSRDRHMRFKGLIKFFGSGSYATRKVEIGYLDQGKFTPLNGAAPDGRRLFLRLKGKEYF